MPPVSQYAVTLGRIKLPTLIAPADTFGDGIEAVGAVLVAAERKPRPLELTLAVRGATTDADPKIAGDRLRRQITGLLENARARLEGLWLSFEADPLIDSYIIVGGGKLAIDDPSLVLGDYALELQDVYRVGKAASHRPARRADFRDLRSTSAWRDRKRTFYSGDFAEPAPGAPMPVGSDYLLFWPRGSSLALPVGASDLMVGDDAIAPTGTRTGLEGAMPLITVDPSPDPALGETAKQGFTLPGAVVDFDQAVADRGKGDVTVLDVRGQPLSSTAWEEAYGPAHPINPLDVPVVQNSLARARWDYTRGCVIVEQPVAGVWTERVRVMPLPAVNVTETRLRFDVLNSASIVEWTPERAVIRITLTDTGPQRARGELYITLQRGWTAPLFELYVNGQRGAKLAVTLSDNVAWFGHQPEPSTGTAGTAFVNAIASDDPGAAWTDVTPRRFHAQRLPFLCAQRADGAGAAVSIAVVDARSTIATTTSSDAIGSSRREIELTGYIDTLAPSGEGSSSVFARLGLGTPGKMIDAETYRATGSGYTAVQIADASAAGGQAVKDTLAPAGAPYSVSLTYAQLQALGLLTGEYTVWVRTRADGAGASFVLFQLSYRDALTGAIVDSDDLNQFNSGGGPTNVYRWNPLPGIFEWIREHAAPGDPTTRYLMIRAKTPGAPAAAVIDRILLLPRARSKALLYADAPGTAPMDGPADVAAELLLETRSVPTLVSR